MLDLYQLKYHISFAQKKIHKIFLKVKLIELYVYFIGFLFSLIAYSPHYLGHLFKVTILQNLVENLMI